MSPFSLLTADTDTSSIEALATPRVLGNSHFKREYEAVEAPKFQDQLLGAVREILAQHCTRHGVSTAECTIFFERLQSEAFRYQDELLTQIPALAQRMWTSALLISDSHEQELCSILNKAIRMDIPECMPQIAIVARAINQLCVVRRPKADLRFPLRGICWRGGGLPDAHQPFYVPGKKYRVPGFLATSFSENVAQEFLYRAHVLKQWPAVKWVIELDPRGELNFQYRCKHVDLVRRSNVPGEEEFLFAPYSVFTVLEVHWACPATDDDPHVVRLQAAIDNRKEPEDLPLAPWY